MAFGCFSWADSGPYLPYVQQSAIRALGLSMLPPRESARSVDLSEFGWAPGHSRPIGAAHGSVEAGRGLILPRPTVAADVDAGKFWLDASLLHGGRFAVSGTTSAAIVPFATVPSATASLALSFELAGRGHPGVPPTPLRRRHRDHPFQTAVPTVLRRAPWRYGQERSRRRCHGLPLCTARKPGGGRTCMLTAVPGRTINALESLRLNRLSRPFAFRNAP